MTALHNTEFLVVSADPCELR